MKNYSELKEKANKLILKISCQDLAIKMSSYGMRFETFECQECGQDTPKYMRYANFDICQGCGSCA